MHLKSSSLYSGMGVHQGKLAPNELDDLTRRTTFNTQEVRTWYEKFLKDYPHGYMNKEQFKKVYKGYYRDGDSEKFAEHVFRVFDVNKDGKIGKKEEFSRNLDWKVILNIKH